MTELTYTLREALDEVYEMSRNIAHLIGTANIDVADEFGDENALERITFLRPDPAGGDKPTEYARRLGRMLTERLLVDYVITPVDADGVQTIPVHTIGDSDG